MPTATSTSQTSVGASLPSYDTLDSVVVPKPPTYSTVPYDNEETVAFTPRLGSSDSSPHGNYVKNWPQATLILIDQEEETRLPTYGRGGRIAGELALVSTERVVRVSVKLLGQMSLSVADSGSMDIPLVSEILMLYDQQQQGDSQTPDQTEMPSHTRRFSLSRSQRRSSSSSSSSGDNQIINRCPSAFPISIQLPTTYEWAKKRYRMPPSFEATFLSLPALFVRCLYTLSVTITRTRGWNLGSWTTSKTYTTLINYHPRTRPPRPIVLLDTVVNSIKPVPEEWTQIVARMNIRPKFTLMKPIECQLFVPSTQSFPLSEPIPFHLQLISSLASLRELLPPNSSLLRTANCATPSSSGNPSPSNSNSPACTHPGTTLLGPGVLTGFIPSTPYGNVDVNHTAPVNGIGPRTITPTAGSNAIRVTIARQVVVEIGEKTRFRTLTIGVGRMWPLPPQSQGGRDGRNWNGSRNVSVDDLHRPGQAGKDEDKEDVCLDWQGEVKCWPEVVAGGFGASGLHVKDFLVLALTPPTPRSSFLVPLQLSHPIRLVTDAWVDSENAIHPSDR